MDKIVTEHIYALAYKKRIEELEGQLSTAYAENARLRPVFEASECVAIAYSETSGEEVPYMLGAELNALTSRLEEYHLAVGKEEPHDRR